MKNRDCELQRTGNDREMSAHDGGILNAIARKQSTYCAVCFHDPGMSMKKHIKLDIIQSLQLGKSKSHKSMDDDDRGFTPLFRSADCQTCRR